MVASATTIMIEAFCSHDTSDTSSRKLFKKDGADNPLHDEVDYSIASHQKSVFLVQSHLVQEEGQTKMIDNTSMSAPAQVTHNNTVSTAAPT